MPYILHIDTSGPLGIAMLARNGLPVASRSSTGERDHAGNINRLVAEVLSGGGIGFSDIDAIAVCNGPGSYTGLRIGLATAKGYCYVLGKPLILHNRLVLMLREVKRLYPAGDAAALIPARNGEYYAAAAGISLNFAPEHIITENLIRRFQELGEPFYIIGSMESDIMPFIELKSVIHIAHHTPDEYSWAIAAAESFTSGNFAAIAYAEPEYLKPAFITKSRANKQNDRAS